eukprot:2941685-Pyramimonas_sp.AAC.1
MIFHNWPNQRRAEQVCSIGALERAWRGRANEDAWSTAGHGEHGRPGGIRANYHSVSLNRARLNIAMFVFWAQGC